MDAHPSNVSNILAGEKQFSIPYFQRFYSWKYDSWQHLWSDSAALLEDPEGQVEHFIGPFVTLATAYPYDITRFTVIDGQQRLFTLTIILVALRDIALKRGFDSLATVIESNYLYFFDARGRKFYKLQPRAKDREALLQLIDRNEEPNSETLIVKAYQFFEGEIKNLLERGGDDELELLTALYEALTKRLQLIMITLGPKDNPSNIFESLNFKGEKLSEADLLRNFFFLQIPSDQQDSFEEQFWQPFESLFADNKTQGINTEQLTDFYYHYYLICKGDYVPRQALYGEFSQYISSAIKQSERPGHETIKYLAQELKRFAQYYLAIIEVEEQDKDIEAAFLRFHHLATFTARPLVLSLYERYKNRNAEYRLSKQELLQMLVAVESFILRRSITKESTRLYGPDFARAVQKSSDYAGLSDYFKAKGWPTDNEVEQALLTLQIYRRERGKCPLILREIERSFGYREGPNLDDRKTISVEHVMPQTLTAEWRRALGPEAQQIHDKYKDTLGNLTLTAYNNKLGGKPFLAKREQFLKSGFQLNKYFQDVSNWNEQEIELRTCHLARMFATLWPGPEEDVNTRLF